VSRRLAPTTVWVVDTNVLVAGLLTADSESPPARILNAMLEGELRFLLCVELLAEYRTVMLRKRIQRHHGLEVSEVDALLEAFATDAIVADNFLWQLLAARPGAGLFTGDSSLQKKPPSGTRVISPRQWLDERIS
jgi:uncharacterized protein